MSEREEHIRRLVDAAPPLTAEQRERLAGLLRPAGRVPQDRLGADSVVSHEHPRLTIEKGVHAHE